MTCEQAIVAMNLALDGILEPGQVQDLEEHLSQCESCRRRYQSYQSIAKGLRSLGDEAPVNLHETIMTAIAGETRRKPLRFPKGIAAIAAIAAMLVLVVVAGNPLWSTKRSADQTGEISLFTIDDAVPPAAHNKGVLAYGEAESIIEDEAIPADAPELETADSGKTASDIPAGYGAYLVVIGASPIPEIFGELRLADGYLYAEIPMEDMEAVARQLTAAGFTVEENRESLPETDAQSDVCLVVIWME